jgi:hypothetical protein
MPRVFKLLPLLVLPLLLPSCATTGGGGSGGSTRVLTAEQIADLPVMTAYEAVQRVRPQWLRTRSSPTMANPRPALAVVYLDGVRTGDATELRRIRAREVERMEYLTPSDATNRFGTGHQGGAILVTTR